MLIFIAGYEQDVFEQTVTRR